MAKRKAAPKRKAATTRGAKTVRKPAARKAAKRSAAKRPAAKASKAKAKKKALKKTARPAAKTKKVAARKVAAKKGAPKKVAAKKAAPKAVVRKPAPKAVAAKKAAAVAKPAPKATPKAAAKPAAKAAPKPATKAAKPKNTDAITGTHVAHIFRERRTITDDDVVPTPPSSLDLDQTASAARSGGRGLADRIRKHTDTSPELTAGDVDADWESAESSGEEAPGGDNPTPDQDVVDEIGHALGLDYEEDEELDTEGKLTDRDEHRWELDPESSEDFDER
jgi:hypothetical protein